MLRLTPLRTMTRTGAMLSGDQLVEGAADVLRSCGRLERVRERVAEVEDLPLPLVVGVAQANRRLEGRRAADELVVRQLPERLAREQAGLHRLCHPLAALLRGKRLEQRRIDHGAYGPVKRADEVL